MWVKSGICYLLYLKSLPFVHVQREGAQTHHQKTAPLFPVMTASLLTSSALFMRKPCLRPGFPFTTGLCRGILKI